MYNGIGLTTPRGRYLVIGFCPFIRIDSVCSGTNGYVVRNLSVLRSHQPAQDRNTSWDSAPPKHREPDQGILEHEKKRNIEVKCLELQVKLEDDGCVRPDESHIYIRS
jgi:serine/arginine repetitive matrix protein 2